MSDFIRVPRAFKKRSKRSVLDVDDLVSGGRLGGAAAAACGSGSAGGGAGVVHHFAEMGRKSVKEKDAAVRRSFKQQAHRGSVKERWLLTRKTWKYMTDAGRRLLPEGVGNNKAEDIPKIEQYFQEVCRNEPKFLVWRRKCSYPGAVGPIPRRRWKRRFDTVSSPKKAVSADEADDADDMDQLQCDQQLIDMLKQYLQIKEGDEGEEADDEFGGSQISTSTSMISLDTTTSLTNTTAIIGQSRNFAVGRSGVGNVGSSGSVGPGATNTPEPTQRRTQQLYGSGQNRQKNTFPSDHTARRATPFSTFSSHHPRDATALSHLMANMARFQQRSSIRDQISPTVLQDKAALRKLYNQLKMNHLIATTHSDLMRGRGRLPPEYQRSALGIHKTFAFPELSGKPRGLFKSWNKSSQSSDLSNSSLFLKHYDSKTPDPFLYGIDETGAGNDSSPKRPERRGPRFQTMSIQTDAIPLPVLNQISADFQKQLEHEEALMREEEMAQLEADPVAARNERRNSEDVSQSVSDTIKRYLRMARKKPKESDANRFKRINYDRNLRNIKAKGEITKIGDDDGTSKGCQTDEDWIIKSFEELSKDAPATIPAVRPTTLPRPGKSALKQEFGGGATQTSASSPSSPGIVTSSIFHTGTQFLSNLFGHTPATSSLEGSSNDSFYGSSDVAMQKSKSSSNIVSRKIWKSRSKSQSSRSPAPVKPHWTPQVRGI